MAVTLRVAYENDLDAGTVTTDSEVGTLPVANLLDEDIQKIWRALTTSPYVIGDAGTTLTLGYLLLVNTNALPGDTFQIRASTSDATVTSSLSYDSGSIATGVDPTQKRFLHILPAAVSYRYVRVDFSQTVAPDAGRISAGSMWTPSRHMSVVVSPPERIWRDFSRRTYTTGLNIFNDIKPRQYGYRFVLHNLPESEVLSQVDELNRLRGTSRDILVCWDSDDPNSGTNAVWGQMEVPAREVRNGKDWDVEIEVWNRL